MKRSVVAYVVRDGLMLSVTRPDTGQHAAPGGKLEPGETPEDALSRELAEEAGVRVRSAWRVFDGAYNGHLVRVYRAEIEGEPIALEPHTRVEWVEPARIANGFASELHRQALVEARILSPVENPEPTLREKLTAIVAKLMAGSPEPVEHTHIECQCPGLIHRTDNYEEGCFCPKCASEEAVRRGLSADDTEPENEEPDDDLRWCNKCDALITFEVTEEGAIKELAHWQNESPSFDAAILNSPTKWREFMICLKSLPDDLLPQAQAVIERGLKLA